MHKIYEKITTRPKLVIEQRLYPLFTVVSFLLGYMSTHGLLAQLGIFIGRGTLCSLAIVMLALPGMLYVFDGLIRCTTKNISFFGGDQNEKS